MGIKQKPYGRSGDFSHPYDLRNKPHIVSRGRKWSVKSYNTVRLPDFVDKKHGDLGMQSGHVAKCNEMRV